MKKDILYTFYLIKNITGEIMDPPVIYAVTDKKELAKGFKRNRDMDKFYCKEIECTHLEAIQNMDRLNKYILTETAFTTQDEEGGIATVNIIVTWQEEAEIMLASQNLFAKMIFPFIIDHKVFSEESIHFLEKIDYIKMENIKYKREHLFPDTEMEELSVTFDELSLFIKTYGWTLKIKENENERI